MKTDEQRRQELQEYFSTQEGWSGNEEFRIQEKENDALMCIQKINNQVNYLISNATVLAIPNENLLEFQVQAQDLADIITNEFNSRQ